MADVQDDITDGDLDNRNGENKRTPFLRPRKQNAAPAITCAAKKRIKKDFLAKPLLDVLGKPLLDVIFPREGVEFQAKIPEFIQDNRSALQIRERATCLWSPDNDLEDDTVEPCIYWAKEKRGLDEDQFLGLLKWHNFDAEKALRDSCNFTKWSAPVWPDVKQELFKEALVKFKKDFHAFHELIPDKSTDEIVRYYYDVYKPQMRQKLREDQEMGEGGGEILNAAPTISDKVAWMQCAGCQRKISEGKFCSKGILCCFCFEQWRFTATSRGEVEWETETMDDLVQKPEPDLRGTEKPKGLSTDPELMKFVASDAGKAQIAKEIKLEAQWKDQIKTNKKMIRWLRAAGQLNVKDYQPEELDEVLVHSKKWTKEDRLTAFLAVIVHGEDNEVIAELVGTKTVDQVTALFQQESANHAVYLAKHKKQMALIAAKNRIQTIDDDEPEVIDISCDDDIDMSSTSK